MLSTMFVRASERHSYFGNPSRVTASDFACCFEGRGRDGVPVQPVDANHINQWHMSSLASPFSQAWHNFYRDSADSRNEQNVLSPADVTDLMKKNWEDRHGNASIPMSVGDDPTNSNEISDAEAPAPAEAENSLRVKGARA